MKFFTIIIINLLIISCGPSSNKSVSEGIDKSVIEELTLYELKVEIENDPSFEQIYLLIDTIKKSYVIRDVDKVKWLDLSYQEAADYIKVRKVILSIP